MAGLQFHCVGCECLPNRLLKYVPRNGEFSRSRGDDSVFSTF
jgi:hypothetical protein